jgi:transcriptional regulator with XRE-family HTH domain
METAQGQAMVKEARKALASAIDSHGLAPLAALRLRQGLSQKELCEACDLPQPHLSRLENGKVANPDADTLLALSQGLGVGMEEVLAAIRQGVRA